MTGHNAFLEKIEPHLLSNDPFIQESVLQMLMEYPLVPDEWVTKLLDAAFKSQDKLSPILNHSTHFKINEDALGILIKGMKGLSKANKTMALRIIQNADPELLIKYKQELRTFYPEKAWALYDLLKNGTEDNIWETFGETLSELDSAKEFDYDLYQQGKQIVRTLVNKGWYDKTEVGNAIKQELEEQWFSFSGILAVYAAKLLKASEYTPLLESLMDREDDVLLEEIASAFISFQSDEVLEAVRPHLKDKVSGVYAVSVFQNTKSEASVATLRNTYKKLTDNDDKALIIEALCHQLSETAMPEIQNYMSLNFSSVMVDVEEVAYSFYKILNKAHPDLEIWHQIASERDKRYREAVEKVKHNVVDEKEDIQKPVVNAVKVGRNDPCPCGSGKKYKKCCGK